MNPRRMETEAVRDNVLHVAGSLDRTIGGPDLDPELGLKSTRRSLYFRHAKEKRVMFLRLFDSPNVLSCYRRSDSVTPQQALALANSSLCLEQARLLAGKLERGLADSHEAGLAHERAFVIAAFERVLCRRPTPAELAACADYLWPAPGSSPIGRAWPPFPAARPPPSPLRPTRPSEPGKTWFTCSSTITILSRFDDDMITRRSFFSEMGLGLGGVALSAMLNRDGLAQAGGAGQPAWKPPDGKPHFTPKARNVIWLFMIGGTSHLESFDPKPALDRYAGKTIAETPFAGCPQEQAASSNVRIVVPDDANGHIRQMLYPLQVGYRKHGECGIEVSDLLPHVGSCIDDIAVIRSMWTTDNNHGAQLQFHSGRHMLEGQFPTIGSWVHYGLGSLNDDLPQFIVARYADRRLLRRPGGHGASYLGPGIRRQSSSRSIPRTRFAFARPSAIVSQEEQAGRVRAPRAGSIVSRAARHPEDAALRARIKSYELAFRMQTAVPDVVNSGTRIAETKPPLWTGPAAMPPVRRCRCLAARRMVERGVRFVQIFHGSKRGRRLGCSQRSRANHATQCAQVDRPIGGLLTDLKQRGLLDETIVVWATEFGRTPGSQGGDGRDHHPFGFSVWMAGGGIKGGVAHGATDELGFHAVEDRHYVTDIHATLLHQLGLDPRRLEVPGQKRLEIDFGEPIREIIA